MDKIILTLDGILDRYFYKEWVQQELRDVGEPVSGDKNQLIKRFLNSERIRRKPVDEIATSLLSSLRKTDLKLIAIDLGIEAQGNLDQLQKRIFNSVVFEPYVRRTTRHCNVCIKETRHELHFRTDWQADRFVCDVCRTENSAQPTKSESQGSQPLLQPIIDVQRIESNPAQLNVRTGGDSVVSFEEHLPTASAKPQGASGDNSDDSISHQALAWAIALGGLGVFLAVSIPLGLTYGWIGGVAAGIVATIVAGILLIPTRHRWMSTLLKMVK